MRRLASAPAFLALAGNARADTYPHMGDWGYGYGVGMMFGPVLWLIVLGLVVAGVIWLVRRTDGVSGAGGASKAQAELDMRLARGEISVEEHAARKKALIG